MSWCPPRDYGGLEGGREKWKAKDKEPLRAPLRRWKESVLDTLYLPKGGISAFPPSGLPHKSQELKEVEEVL